MVCYAYIHQKASPNYLDFFNNGLFKGIYSTHLKTSSLFPRNNSSVNNKKSKKGFVKDFTSNNLTEVTGRHMNYVIIA